jgi:hypothetical protein
MSRLTLAAIRRGDLRCHDCNKRLNKKNVAYREYTYPLGTVELIPVCRGCKEATS